MNDIVEQDHRRVKHRIYPMLGFKNFRNAAVTIRGVELAQKLRKGQLRHVSVDSGR
ncbi:MAG: DDE-type integrase/transposase/recombinase [Rubrivivax sp.]|nr:DDE-type integrase/transposase/recombinase [Pyrinomonadaceae bacterium]